MTVFSNPSTLTQRSNFAKRCLSRIHAIFYSLSLRKDTSLGKDTKISALKNVSENECAPLILTKREVDIDRPCGNKRLEENIHHCIKRT